MPPPFQDLDLGEFVHLLRRFPFERAVTALHLHHSWRPRTCDWRGHRSLRAMYSMHTLQHGWSDIAHHLAIAPDGVIWTGRDWNRPPCSVPGMNGDRKAGPFMIVLIGDFNRSADTLAGTQYERLLRVVAWMRRLGRERALFDVPDDAIRFHAELSGARGLSCPGDTIDRARLLADLAAALAAPDDVPPSRSGATPFGEDAESWFEFIGLCAANDTLIDEPRNTPSEYTEMTLAPAPGGTSPPSP